MMEPTASGLRMSFFIPSLKNVVDSLMTSFWRFSSSSAGLNLLRLIWLLNRFFFGILSVILRSGLLNQKKFSDR